MRRLRPSGGVVLSLALAAAAAAAAAGCGGPVTSPGGTAPATFSASPAAQGSGGPSVGRSVDGSARLTSAFRTLAAGYRFDTSVTISGQLATHAAGRWLGGRSEFVVESGGAALTYRSIPPRSWVQQEGASWVELLDKAPSGDPLEPLRHPSAVTVASDSADGLVLRATYPPRALGAAGEVPVVVQISLAPDGRTTATYTVTTAPGPATTVTILAPGPGIAPIAVP